MSRTGELVISLQDQVEQLTVAVRSLERHLPPPLVTVQDAAERLGVSVNTVRRRVKSGDIPCTRIGKALRIDLTKGAVAGFGHGGGGFGQGGGGFGHGGGHR